MGVRLHSEHGVAPILQNCFLCGESKGIILAGASCQKLAKSAGYESYERMGSRGMCTDMEPCDKCKGYMTQGVIIIGVDESKTTDRKNPYRTGHFCVLKDEAIKRLVNPEILDKVLEMRVMYMPGEEMVAMGMCQAEETG